MEELDKIKKESTLKEAQLQEQIAYLERMTNFSASDYIPTTTHKTGRSQTQVAASTKSGGMVNHHDLGQAIKSINQRKNQERIMNASLVGKDDSLNITHTDFYQK